MLWVLVPCWAKLERALERNVLSHDEALFNVMALPTVPYGSDIWDPFCSAVSQPDIRKMADVHMALL